ncbi:MAG: hypothetical protein AAF717_00475 [Bacteroidota bacterium]
MLKKVVPYVFYSNIEVGINLFVNTLGFSEVFRQGEGDSTLVVIEREGVSINLRENKEFAAKDRPELRIETDDIDSLYDEVLSKDKTMLHPNLNSVTMRPWGCKEFALLDETQLCVVLYQWV